MRCPAIQFDLLEVAYHSFGKILNQHSYGYNIRSNIPVKSYEIYTINSATKSVISILHVVFNTIKEYGILLKIIF